MFPQLFKSNQTGETIVIVKLDVRLEFCPKAGKTGGCTKRRFSSCYIYALSLSKKVVNLVINVKDRPIMATSNRPV